MATSGYFATLQKDGKKFVDSLLGRSKESFTDAYEEAYTAVGTIVLIIIIILIIISAGGAASLSWNYNMFLGNPKGLSFFYAILAFLFSGFYYPLYAYFLNPITGLTRAITPNLRGINNVNKRKLIAALTS